MTDLKLEMEFIKMKIFRALTSAFLVLLLFGCQTSSEQVAEVTSVQLPLPNLGESPLYNGKVVTLEEAQAQTAYHIPLPDRTEIDRVWLQTTREGSLEGPISHSVAIRFENEVLLIIHQFNQQPDWDSTTSQIQEFEKTFVNGIPGMGADPGVKIIHGEEYPYPGSVAWWVDGLDITLYSDTMKLDELLALAQTVH